MATMTKASGAGGPSVQELQQQVQFNEKFKFVINRIHSAKNITEILVQLQTDILGLFDADRITIYAVNPKRRELFSKHMAGNEVKEIRVPISPASISGFCAHSGRTLNISDVYNAAELIRLDKSLKFDKSWDKKTGFRSKQMLVVPIVIDKKLMGVVQLINKKSGGPYTKPDEQNLLEIARTLGIAFRNQSRMVKTRFDYLIENNIVTDSEIKQAMGQSRELKTDMEHILIENFKVKKADIGKSLSEFYGCKFVENPNNLIIDRKLLVGLNLNYLRKAYWMPISQNEKGVTVLIDNPKDPKVMELQGYLKAKSYEFHVAFKEDILKAIDIAESDDTGGSADSPLGASDDSVSDILAEMDVGVEGPEEGTDADAPDENAGAIVRLVNQIIIDGYKKGCSDIHVEPSKRAKKTTIRFRVDGTCFKHLEVPLSHSPALVSRLKIMAGLDIAERRLPQDGKIKFFFQSKQIELRVATLPTVGGEDVVMRILAASEPMTVKELGLNKRNEVELLKMVDIPYGIMLVVGPTGSGKTTTLHACVGHINTPERKIWTAEDPVEITQEGLRQVEVKPKIDFTFARAMRAFLRADPDVILVGEMRDFETAAIGIEASLTGHLVFSTLHTNSAPETITRLIDMGIDPFNFADALLGILAQRLVKTLCKDCKEEYHPDQAEYNEIVDAYGKDMWPELGIKYDDKFKLFKVKGCNECNHSGYRGRAGIHELLVGTDDVREIIQQKAGVVKIQEQAIKDGMRTLFQDGIMKVLAGRTDISMVRRVCMQ
jgi:type II secretory ATPase GspE/PulE/Tfp pilus assembly ATPase PilB-like protein/putative methionine-R-sulfoxide reductase with GAF domain